MTQEVVEAIHLPALLVATDGRIDSSNKTARHLFGNAIQGRHYITVLRQPALLDAVEMALTKAQQSKASYLTTEARNDVTLEATCTPLPSGFVLIVLEDRTATEHAGQMRRDFVANVSHELRTPLTALSGFIETLRGAAKDDPDARERFLSIMEREAGRMNRLVADLLSLSRVEVDERVRPTTEVDLSAIVRAVLGSLATLVEKNNSTIVTDGLEHPANLPGAADQLSQVVTNLVENAIKYSGEGCTVTIKLHHEPNNPMIRGDAWVLEVSDTGQGIDPLHIPRLTERFYRIDSHRSREMGGTGLGLAIVKHIINRHRGRLRIESSLGKGSRFLVILPASSEQHNAAPA